jgi:hypothetical protein
MRHSDWKSSRRSFSAFFLAACVASGGMFLSFRPPTFGAGRPALIEYDGPDVPATMAAPGGEQVAGNLWLAPISASASDAARTIIVET